MRAENLAAFAKVGNLHGRDLPRTWLIGRDSQRKLAAHLAVAQILFFQVSRKLGEGREIDVFRQDDRRGDGTDCCDRQVQGIAHVRFGLVHARGHRGCVGARRSAQRARLCVGVGPGIGRHSGQQGGQDPLNQCRNLRARASKKLVRAGR